MHTFVHLTHAYGPYIFTGIKVTLLLTGGSMLLSLIAGLCLALARMSRRRLLRIPAKLYIDFIRGTPVLLHLFIVYYGAPTIGIQTTAVEAAIIAFGLNGAAFMAEIYRSGFIAVAREQMDGARALGMSYAHALRRIILPQAFYVIMPPTANFAVSTLKETSLALVIAVPEITYRTYNAISYTFQGMPLIVLASIAYLVLTLPLSQSVNLLEKRVARKRAP